MLYKKLIIFINNECVCVLTSFIMMLISKIFSFYFILILTWLNKDKLIMCNAKIKTFITKDICISI